MSKMNVFSDKEAASVALQCDEDELSHQSIQPGTLYSDGFIESRNVWAKGDFEVEVFESRDEFVVYDPNGKEFRFQK